MAKVKPVPEGTHTITPGLFVRGGRKAIDFYKTAFGAKELSVAYGPDGKSVMHAELKLGDSKLYIGDEDRDSGSLAPPSLGGSAVVMHVYTENCDEMFERAVDAGATVQMPLADMFWGDRYGRLIDPFGHLWGIATHKEDMSPDEMERRMKESFAASARK